MRARRRDVRDLYVDGDECVVFVGDRVLTLGARATLAYLAVGEAWTPDEEVAEVLGSAIGEPPDGTSLVEATRATLQELTDLEVIEVDNA